MSHLSELMCAMAADSELSAAEAAHFESCAECQGRVDALATEGRLIRSALLMPDEVTVPSTPTFRRPLSLGTFAMVNLGTGLLVWLAQFLWKTVLGELAINLLAEAGAMYVPNAYEITVNTAMHFYEEGTTMIDAYLGLVVSGLIFLGAVWFTHSYRQFRAAANLCMLALIGAIMMAPAPAQALEVRRGGEGAIVTIAEDEVINDSVLMAGETLIVDGTVTGDLFAAGRRVVINGTVGGNLVTFAQSITIEGSVGGTALGAGQSYELFDARVAGDLWAAGETIRLVGDTEVTGNATTASETVIIEGSVGRDLTMAMESAEISGSVGEDVEAYGARVNLLGDAVVEGDLRFRTQNEDNLQQSSGAVVRGNIEFTDLPEQMAPTNRYLSMEFYLYELLGLVAAFVTGFVVLWFVPRLRDATLESGIKGFKTAGIGLVALVSVPVISALLAFTVVGLPLTVLGFLFWGISIYLAKVVVGSFIGQMVLSGTGRENSLPITLLIGLAGVVVATNLPVVGGVIAFIVTIVGIGMIVRTILSYTADLSDA